MPGGSLERFSWESLGCGTPGLPPDSAPLLIGPSGLTLKGDLTKLPHSTGAASFASTGKGHTFRMDWVVKLHEAAVEVQEEHARHAKKLGLERVAVQAEERADRARQCAQRERARTASVAGHPESPQTRLRSARLRELEVISASLWRRTSSP